DGLRAAAVEVEVGDLVRPQDAERVEALRRHVHVPVDVRGGGADEEHRLRRQEGGEPLVDPVEDLRHRTAPLLEGPCQTSRASSRSRTVPWRARKRSGVSASAGTSTPSAARLSANGVPVSQVRIAADWTTL